MADRTGIFGQFQFSFFDLHLKFIFDQHKFLLQRAVKLTQVIKLVGRQYTYDLLGHFKDLVMLIVINRKCVQQSRSFDFENTVSFVVTEIKMLTGQFKILRKSIDFRWAGLRNFQNLFCFHKMLQALPQLLLHQKHIRLIADIFCCIIAKILFCRKYRIIIFSLYHTGHERIAKITDIPVF